MRAVADRSRGSPVPHSLAHTGVREEMREASVPTSCPPSADKRTMQGSKEQGSKGARSKGAASSSASEPQATATEEPTYRATCPGSYPPGDARASQQRGGARQPGRASLCPDRGQPSGAAPDLFGSKLRLEGPSSIMRSISSCAMNLLTSDAIRMPRSRIMSSDHCTATVLLARLAACTGTWHSTCPCS
eukprot:545126-Rhodomonas_salina.1